MAKPETLSVRLDLDTRRTLDEAAVKRGAAGASALAREILERWAAEHRAVQARNGVQQVVSYLKANPGGWSDDPSDFFPDAGKRK
jgi:hypothetical protein